MLPSHSIVQVTPLCLAKSTPTRVSNQPNYPPHACWLTFEPKLSNLKYYYSFPEEEEEVNVDDDDEMAVLIG
ncbi:hypothetical protein AAC387_Pa06g0358 [Persea americana]